MHQPQHLSEKDLMRWRRAQTVKRVIVCLAIVVALVAIVLAAVKGFASNKHSSDTGVPDPIPSSSEAIMVSTTDNVEGEGDYIDISMAEKVDVIKEVLRQGKLLAEPMPYVDSMDFEVILLADEMQSVIPEPVISAIGPGTVYYYELTYEEKVELAKLVYAESRGEPFKGKVAVAAVALNRYHSDVKFFWKDTLHDTITQPYQFADFSMVTDEMLEEIPECMEAVDAACRGWDPTREVFENGALYFFNPDKIDEEQTARRAGVEIMEIGHHNFHIDFAY